MASQPSAWCLCDPAPEAVKRQLLRVSWTAIGPKIKPAISYFSTAKRLEECAVGEPGRLLL